VLRATVKGDADGFSSGRFRADTAVDLDFRNFADSGDHRHPDPLCGRARADHRPGPRVDVLAIAYLLLLAGVLFRRI
jgi:hypothetical protein